VLFESSYRTSKVDTPHAHPETEAAALHGMQAALLFRKPDTMPHTRVVETKSLTNRAHQNVPCMSPGADAVSHQTKARDKKRNQRANTVNKKNKDTHIKVIQLRIKDASLIKQLVSMQARGSTTDSFS
jgi:hypothetical protein